MKEITGLRIARSFLTPSGDSELTAIMDFDLGPRIGIAIHDVLGTMHRINVPASTSHAEHYGVQSLHLEGGTLEAVPNAAGDDEVNIDTEIFYIQTHSVISQTEASTRGGSGYAISVTPSGLVHYARPIIAVRNITHAAETIVTNHEGGMQVLVFYAYVELTRNEMGFWLASRR